MYGTPKPTASLTSGLLARKGHARPAMRPQGYVALSPGQPEDLGWNDMGDEHLYPQTPQPQPVAVPVPVAPAATPAAPTPPPPVLRQRAALDEQFPRQPDPEPEPAPAAEPEPQPVGATMSPRVLARVVREVNAKKTKAAFTLRLDPDRHLRLRLASAVRNQSAQLLVTEALDVFLESLTDVDGLARQLGAREGRD